MALDFVAGCLGGCAGVMVGHPLDTVKVCIQAQDPKNPRFKNSFHCLQSIFAKEGVRGLYRGVTSPLLGVAGINAIVFGIYGNTQRQMANPESLASHAIAGAFAGFAQSFICSPMELAKGALQLGNTTSKSPGNYLRMVYRTSGIKGVFKGLNVTIAREVPAFGTYFITYEYVTRRKDNLPVSTFSMLMGGGLAGVVSWVIVYPVDVVKTRFQLSSQYKSAFDCLKQSVKTEGVVCLFRGLSPTILRAFPVNAVTFTVVTWTMKLFNNVNFGYSFGNTDVFLKKYTDMDLIDVIEVM